MMQSSANDRLFMPIILGSDENAYGTARLFREICGVKPLLVCTRGLIPTVYSSLFTLKTVEGFDTDDVFCRELLKLLSEYKKTYDRIVVVPCSDYYLSLLSRHYDSFSGLIENKFIPRALLETLDTKDKFYALCEKHGMDYPRTYVAAPEERLSAADSIPFDFPIVVKPENSNASEYLHASFEGKKKVFFFDDKESYIKTMESMNRSGYKGKIIIQEFIGGGDDSMRVVNTYSDAEGRVRAVCLGQPVLEEYAPKTLGNYAAIISRKDRALCERIKKFLEDIGYVGFGNIDMKYDRKSGRYLMFEINPRLGRSSYFVRGAGLNMMKVLCDDAVFKKPYSCAYGEEVSLWSNVPKSVIFKYVKDESLKKEARELIKSGKYSRTLDCAEDFNLRRFMWIKRYYLGQYKNFKRFYFEKNK